MSAPTANEITDLPPNQVVAMLLATGKYTVLEIARQLSVPPSRIYALKSSQLFQTLVAEYAARFQSDAIDDVMHELREDALHNVKFLMNVRDGKEKDSPKDMPFRMRAAEILFDRQLPKKTDQGSATPKVVVNISTERRTRMEAAMTEDGGDVIDVTDTINLDDV